MWHCNACGAMHSYGSRERRIASRLEEGTGKSRAVGAQSHRTETRLVRMLSVAICRSMRSILRRRIAARGREVIANTFLNPHKLGAGVVTGDSNMALHPPAIVGLDWDAFPRGSLPAATFGREDVLLQSQAFHDCPTHLTQGGCPIVKLGFNPLPGVPAEEVPRGWHGTSHIA